MSSQTLFYEQGHCYTERGLSLLVPVKGNINYTTQTHSIQLCVWDFAGTACSPNIGVLGSCPTYGPVYLQIQCKSIVLKDGSF